MNNTLIATVLFAATTAQAIPITVCLDGVPHEAELQDNPTSRALLAQMPFTLNLEPYGGEEMIAHLPQRLSTENAPKRYQGKAGDITYYAPWGNLALFTGTGPNASGLIYLGKFTQGFGKLSQAKTVTFTQKQD